MPVYEEPLDAERTRTQRGTEARELEDILRSAISLIEGSKAMPLSSSVLVPRDEILSLLDSALDAMPRELKDAQWMLKERQEFLDRVNLEADQILDRARATAESFVAKTEVVRQANAQAANIIQDAKEAASKMRYEAEAYADEKLGNFEITLEQTLKTVKTGRERLAAGTGPRDSGHSAIRQAAEDAFFDQRNS